MDSPLPPDPYAALGVSKDADSAAIKTAYRKLVLKTHPDKFPDPVQKAEKGAEFYKFQQAYEILGDDDKREHYDAWVRLAKLRVEAMERQQRINAAKADTTRPNSTTNYHRTPSRTPYPTQPASRAQEESRTRAAYDDQPRVKSRSTEHNVREESNMHESKQNMSTRPRTISSRKREHKIPLNEQEPRDSNVSVARNSEDVPRDTMKQWKLDSGCENPGSLKNIQDAHTPDQPKQPSKYYVPGFLGGHYVQANPDTGASHDMISESYAAANNYYIDLSGAGVVDLPGGRQAGMLGTTTLTFRFESDEKVYSRIFQVMQGLSYSCILGNAFLKLTKTLSVGQNRLNRIRHVVKQATSRIPRFHLIGGVHERIQGTLNGHQISALPDTGSDVNIIRSDVAKRLGLKIWSDERHRKLLELGDGSFVRTMGTAYNAQWCFGPSGSTEPLGCEFQVLDDILCDVILSNDFLFDNSAFELYEHYFYDASSINQLEIYAQLNCITEVPLPEQELDEMMMDVYCCGREEDRIAGIPSIQPPRVDRVRFRLSRQRFSRIFTGNALQNETGSVPSPGDTAIDPTLAPPSTPPQQPKRGWIVRVVRLVIRRSDREASLSASPSSVS